jgi:hypothetical protein
MGAGDRLAMPRFLRECSAPSSSSSAHPPSPASSSTADAEPSVVEELQRRKAAFLAHFKSASVPITAAEDAQPTASDFTSNRSLDGALTPASDADSKCHVCNAPLRLLRLRVGFIRCCWGLSDAADGFFIWLRSIGAGTAGWRYAACTARTKCRCRIWGS